VILDVQDRRHCAEVLLSCANHIHIEASTESDDLYKSIDETMAKVARRMRKFKTRLLKNHRPRKQVVRNIEEHIYRPEMPSDEEKEPEPYIIHQENYRIRHLYADEASMEMELSERSFIVFENARNDRITVVYLRKDGDYGMIEP
jgi:putative sigma-54 modulation protein